MKILMLILIFAGVMSAESSYYEYGKKVTMTKVPSTAITTKSLKSINDNNITYYKNSRGKTVGVKNEIIVKCESEDACLKLFSDYNLTNTKKLASRFYLVTVPQNQELFDLSTKLYEEEDVKMAHPNFVKERFKR